jgi:uncharacterized spore protein YtfJ
MTDQTHDMDSVAGRAVEGLTAVLGEAAPSTVFSEPRQVGDTLLITASAWERAGGFGFGNGGGTDAEGAGGQGSGAGGGGGSQGRPVAVIQITPAGVKVIPVIDFTRIGVTLLLAAVGVWRASRK